MELLLLVAFFLVAFLFFIAGKDDFGRKKVEEVKPEAKAEEVKEELSKDTKKEIFGEQLKKEGNEE